MKWNLVTCGQYGIVTEAKRLPAERREVLVKTWVEGDWCVAVGYLRHPAGDKEWSKFIIPGIGGGMFSHGAIVCLKNSYGPMIALLLEGTKMIVTVSGKCFDPAEIFSNPSLVDIEDIAHALSLICRWSGNTRHHYSVAQHSLAVASLFRNKKDKLDALLHDAAEAYTGDVVHSIKTPDISKLEEALLIGIYQSLGIAYGAMNPMVKKADKWVAYREAAYFFPGRMEKACLDVMGEDIPWMDNRKSWKFFTRQRPTEVKKRFLAEFDWLYQECKNGKSNSI